ncbi:MAG: hypothetical protein K0B08_00135 [Bacteroidales bacterium]|nr:hypothetical protein [Bacteroidales bacterium]
MKSRILVSILAICAGVVLFSCSNPVEKKLPGIWVVEDMEFESEYELDEQLVEASKRSQKSISYELLADKTARVYTGFTTFESEWLYVKNEKSVYIIFPGTYDTILLGRYEDGKLVNIEENPEIRIKTVFVKEKK